MSSYYTTASKSESTVSLLHSSTATRKDCSNALAGLQSSYGFGGSPAVSTLSPKKTKTKTNINAVPVRAQDQRYSATTKNYDAALAGLQTSYGIGGASLPVTPSSSGA